MIELVKDQYYRVEERGRYLIFKFNGTYECDKNPNYYYSFSNMNQHWSKNNSVFMRPDGSSTYPYEFRSSDKKRGLSSFVSIHNREVRLATTREVLLLEACRESNMTITIEEFRNKVLDTILE